MGICSETQGTHTARADPSRGEKKGRSGEYAEVQMLHLMLAGTGRLE